MTFKQWNAILMLAGEVLIVIWLITDIGGGAAELPLSSVAARLLWAGLAMIVFNIVASIATAIVGSIVTRQEFKDERADERDRSVFARSMRNAYFAVSAGGVVTMFVFALGYDPVVAVYSVFIGGMVAGAVGALSQLVYYRVG